MTDSSSLANSLSEPVRQPFWWAALASVGFHGVLGVSAPTISNLINGGNSSNKNIPGSVGFVQLTPAQAGRLPQTKPPTPPTAPFSLVAPVPVPLSPNLAPPLPPPAPPTINLPALPPGMPPPGFFSPLPPSLDPLTAPTAPLPPQIQAPTFNSPSSTTPTILPPLPPGSVIFPPLPGNFDRNIPPPPSLTEAPQLPGVQSEDEAETLKRIIASRGGLPLFPDGAPVFTPEFPIAGRNSGIEGGPKLTQKDPNKRNLIAETPEERLRRQQFDRGQQQLEQQGVPGSNLPRDRETQLAAANTYVALFEKFKKAYPDLEMTGPTPVDIAYPAAACSQKLEGVAVFGAVVSPQGLLKAEPQAIVPTGYSILDSAAKTAIINPALTFPAASTHKLYQVAVAFKYDEKICSGIPATPSTTPASPRPTGPQPPAIAPTQPSPTSQPSPAPAEVQPQFEKPPAGPNKPQPGSKQSPPAPSPAAKPSPSPQPKPSAEVSPSPTPAPSPEAAPAPAEVSPSPAPSPEVAPAPVPSPEVAPSPVPSPEASPSPAEASPAPAAAPSPEAAPAPAAAPSPEAAPSPAEAPASPPTEN